MLPEGQVEGRFARKWRTTHTGSGVETVLADGVSAAKAYNALVEHNRARQVAG